MSTDPTLHRFLEVRQATLLGLDYLQELITAWEIHERGAARDHPQTPPPFLDRALLQQLQTMLEDFLCRLDAMWERRN